MEYLRFFLNNKRLISFGFFLTFFSSFGQTFLISLYVPDIMKEFQLSSIAFGTIYGAATILSGFTLAYAGKFIDHCNLRDYTLLAVLLLIISCLCVAFAPNIIFIFIGLWGIRLSGQGLLSHISNTSISKYFHKTRGTALSLTILGYSVGEAFFPIVIGTLLGYIGWRVSMVTNAFAIMFILTPLVFVTLNNKKFNYHPSTTTKQDAGAFTRLSLWSDKRFYIIAFGSSVLTFTITGLFFYQLILAQEKGWSVKLLSASFVGYALGRTVFSLISGKLIDRFSAVSVFPFYLTPFLLALSALAIFNYPFIALLYLTCSGISMGLNSTVKTAILAEVYGTANLGKIRAVFATITVLSTALSPVLFGLFIDIGLPVTLIAAGSAFVVALAILINSQLPALVRTAKEQATSTSGRFDRTKRKVSLCTE